MSTDELKTLLHESIDTIDDVELLEGLRQIIEASKNDDEIVIPDWQKRILDESEEQVARGEFKTHEEVFKSIDKWLRK
ncbi:MAG: hypothetical protein KF749_01885 [Bacteroidetes bacterium]|nr:hypothetical protein [Bacteroidota bacterium]MCW5894429.1 hypothetical protein [Bacteroidota bacterium]